jgi:CRISPR-associated endonuclease Csy4
MSKYYQEITLIDQAEISLYVVWSKLYTQLHIGLAEIKDANEKVNIGLSFPKYIYEQGDEAKKSKVHLGDKLRIFAETQADLEKLNISKWLERLTDYLHILPIREVTKITGYATYSRKQVKTNAERLARHRVKRGDIGFDEALVRYSNVVTTTDLPYIQMKSLTSEKSFKLFIEKKSATKSETQVFSTYGLSSVSTVPEF